MSEEKKRTDERVPWGKTEWTALLVSASVFFFALGYFVASSLPSGVFTIEGRASLGVEEPPSTVTPAPAEKAVIGDVRINVNTAPPEELCDLPGIGETIAARIVEYRAANGPFTSIEDLKNVKGIGDAIAAKLDGLVKFE